MKPKAAWIAWAFCGFVSLAVIENLINALSNPKPGIGISELVQVSVLGALIPLVFAAVGALIITRQPRNLIGWLLLGPAFSQALGPFLPDFQSWTAAPSSLTWSLYLGLWYSGWEWLLLIFPVFLIMLLFPTGRPPSPRWNWVGYLALGMAACLIFLSTFSESLSLEGVSWKVPNPINFIPDSFSSGSLFGQIWGAGLFVLAISSVASLVVRYRRAASIEREQIKWLLYACGLFGAFYTLSVIQYTLNGDGAWSGGIMLLVFLAMATIPAAIAIAILRYRLWDIDVIIRRTLVYGALTATLALVFFGGVTLLQGLFQAFSGQQSAISIVISTLAIAALFNTLRRRIQNDIDRRFYRKKYDAEKTLESFAANVRNEVELEQMTDHLLRVVAETMQPESVGVWLKPSGNPIKARNA